MPMITLHMHLITNLRHLCNLLLTNHGDEVSAIIDKETITAKKSVKLLGITIDNKLDFNEHISKLCKKVSLKLHALARVSNYMSSDKLRMIMKAFIESQFGYCLEMFKIINNHTSSIMKNIFPLSTNPYRLRNKNLFQTDNVHSVFNGTETISFRGPRTWAPVPENIKK